MPQQINEKCRLCSKLSSIDAQLAHGKEKDNCWNPARCYDRRSHYRRRGVLNEKRRLKRRGNGRSGSRVELLKVEVPSGSAAVVHWYRETKDSPLHALSAELWLDGKRKAMIEPVHTLGLSELQIRTLLVRILDGFSNSAGVKVERFRDAVELKPILCPIRPCPLHPGEN